jgi:putative acetyltransferase
MPKPTGPQLRPATNADREQVKDLVFTALAEYSLKPAPDATDADIDDIEQAYFARGGTFRVLETADGAIIGAYGLYPMEDGSCELRKMYLRRDYRGQGLGKHLLDDALADARRLGFTHVVLETASVLKEAIALYESYGFTPYQPDHLAPRCDQAYRMELE